MSSAPSIGRRLKALQAMKKLQQSCKDKRKKLAFLVVARSFSFCFTQPAQRFARPLRSPPPQMACLSKPERPPPMPLHPTHRASYKSTAPSSQPHRPVHAAARLHLVASTLCLSLWLHDNAAPRPHATNTSANSLLLIPPYPVPSPPPQHTQAIKSPIPVVFLSTTPAPRNPAAANPASFPLPSSRVVVVAQPRRHPFFRRRQRRHPPHLRPRFSLCLCASPPSTQSLPQLPAVHHLHHYYHQHPSLSRRGLDAPTAF